MSELVSNKLAQAVVATVAWCDVLEIPPTTLEIRQWLIDWDGLSPTLETIEAVIDEDEWLRERIERHGAYVTLKGHGYLWDVREDRKVWSMPKWLRARRAARLIRLVPFIRLIAVSNTLAWNGATSDSDIDFFIVTRRSRLWTTRLLIVGLLQLFCLRRHGHKIKNRICLGFWVDETALDFSSLTLKPVDPYFAFWLVTLWPLYGQKTYQKLFGINQLTRQLFSLSPPIEPIGIRSVRESGWWKYGPLAVEWILSGCFGNWLERWLYRLQRRRIYHHRDSAIHQGGTAVVANEHVAKFHENDRREALHRAWKERLSSGVLTS